MKITLVCTLLFGVLLQYSNQQCLTANDNAMPNRFGHLGLYKGQQEFSLGLLHAINQYSPEGNIFFSPYSTYHALLLAYFISAKQTENYLKKALFLDPNQNKADIFKAYKLDRFATQVSSKNASYEFTNANRIYVAQQTAIRSCMKDIFDAELMQANFQANPEAIRLGINEWVENNTHNMIKDLLPFGSIDKQTNLVLVNAAYFKGKWANKFDSRDTKMEVFYISPTKQTIVNMMEVEATFNYDVSEDLKAHILELPYEGEDISMYILLPPFSQEDSVDTVLKRLNAETFQKVVNGSLYPRTVKVSLPKFSLEHTIELVPILEQLGVGNLFQQDADFSVLTGNKELSVGEGIHKAKIEVTEEGTEAAAATALFSWRMLSDDGPPVQFKCNRPFVFFIYNHYLNTVLFVGALRHPEQ